MIFFLLNFFHFILLADVINGVDLDKFNKELIKDGKEFRIHGASHTFGHYVVSYIEGNNIFKAIEFPMTTSSPDSLKIIKKLHRHDKVWIKGNLINSSAPIRHVDVKEIKILESLDLTGSYAYTTELPSDIQNRSILYAKVHTASMDGLFLVIDYKDAVIPVYVSNKKHAMGLYRNDIIAMYFNLRDFPKNPVHLSLNEEKIQPLKVLEPIKVFHEKKAKMIGSLVMYPKSPVINRNVFALEVTTPYGITRDWTLVNFEDPDLFNEITKKLQKIWDDYKATAVVGRNKFRNPKILISAEGVLNVVSPVQANPQILLSKLEDVRLVRTHH